MLYAIFSIVFVCFAAANAAPQGVYITPDGNVGASFGGYHASAGLGGILNGVRGGPQGGLHAQAGTPLGHFASAGLSGAVGPDGTQGIKYAGAVKPQYGGTQVYQPVEAQPVYAQQPTYVQQPAQPVQPVVAQKPATGFNDIFNIPIATLQAVNQYLNNRPPKVVVAPAYVLGRSNSESNAETEAQSSSSSGSSFSSSSSASSSSSSSSSSDNTVAGEVPVEVATVTAVPENAVPGVLVSKRYRTKYDDIFNIPISVLRSVNNLLNG